MFSTRFPAADSPNPLTRLLRDRRAAGSDLLDLTESNPTRAGFRYPAEAIREALADPTVLDYDPRPQGRRSAREAIGAYYAERGARVDPDRILLTASTSEAYSFLFKLLCNPGDAVAVPQPSYPLFEFLAAAEGVRIVPYPLRPAAAGWSLDPEALGKAVDRSVRALLVVSPNNPTGTFLKRRELEAIREIARERGCAIVSDEVFSDFPAGADPDRAPSLAGETTGLAFTLNGLSKVAGLPQMKLGWMVVAGAPPLRDAAISRLAAIADTFLSVGAPVQAAAPRLLDLAGPIRDQIRRRCDENEATLRVLLGDRSPLRQHLREGGWYAVLQTPPDRTDEAWALHWLDAQGVLVHPGYLFGFEEEGMEVVSLLTPPDRFREGIRRIAAATSSSR